MIAQPYQARKCPECSQWIHTGAGPFEGRDRTKTLADVMHWASNHVPPTGEGNRVMIVPLMPFNTEPVEIH